MQTNFIVYIACQPLSTPRQHMPRGQHFDLSKTITTGCAAVEGCAIEPIPGDKSTTKKSPPHKYRVRAKSLIIDMFFLCNEDKPTPSGAPYFATGMEWNGLSLKEDKPTRLGTRFFLRLEWDRLAWNGLFLNEDKNDWEYVMSDLDQLECNAMAWGASLKKWECATYATGTDCNATVVYQSCDTTADGHRVSVKADSTLTPTLNDVKCHYLTNEAVVFGPSKLYAPVLCIGMIQNGRVGCAARYLLDERTP